MRGLSERAADDEWADAKVLPIANEKGKDHRHTCWLAESAAQTGCCCTSARDNWDDDSNTEPGETVHRDGT